MNGQFHRIGRHLYIRSYRTTTGEQTTLYYARFQCRLKKKPRCISLGSSLSLAKDALKKLEAKDIDLYDFDIDKQRQEKEQLRDGRSEPFTFAEWSDVYPNFDDVKRKRSLATDLTLIRLHLKPFFGSLLLTEITRETLRRYVDRRMASTLIRCGKESKKTSTGERSQMSSHYCGA